MSNVPTPSFYATVFFPWSVEPTNMREAELLTLLHLSLLHVTLHTTLQKGDHHNFLLRMKRRCRQTKSSTRGQRIQMPCLALTWHSPDSSERKDPTEELPNQLACGRACELLSWLLLDTVGLSPLWWAPFLPWVDNPEPYTMLAKSQSACEPEISVFCSSHRLIWV